MEITLTPAQLTEILEKCDLRCGDIGRFGSYRIWNGYPEALVHHSDLITLAGDLDSRFKGVCALELLLPTGPRRHYGLLVGASFEGPSRGAAFSGAVSLFSDGEVFNNSLLYKTEKAFLDVPSEYLEAALEGVLSVESPRCGVETKRIVIFAAAYEDVSSSVAVFKKLGKALALVIDATSDEKAAACVKGIFQ